MRYWILFIIGVIAFHFLRITQNEIAKNFLGIVLFVVFMWGIVILATP